MDTAEAAAAETGGDQAAAPTGPTENEQVMRRVEEFLDEQVSRVSQLNMRSIGAVGIVLFIWAGLALAVTLEQGFNHILNAPEGRPWHHRIPIYWAVITLGPVMVYLSISLAGKLVTWAEGVFILSAIVSLFSPLFALSATWLLLFLLYKLMPNTSVRMRPALIGSFVAAVLWEAAKGAFNLYITKALPYAQLYGALALLPLFLLWLYLTWIIVLFGIEITYTLQAMKGGRFKYQLPTHDEGVAGDPQWLIPIMAQVGAAFAAGTTMGHRQIADRLKLPSRAVSELSRRLVRAGLLRRVQTGDEDAMEYTLAQPAERIPIRRILELADTIRVGNQTERTGAAWGMLKQLSATQRQTVGDRALASLIEAPPESAEAASEAAPTGTENTQGDEDDDSTDDAAASADDADDVGDNDAAADDESVESEASTSRHMGS